MTEAREWLIQWARDAHAMEEQAKTMLSGQAQRLENYPELRSRIQQHIQETERQAERLENYLATIGESESTLKDMGGKLMALGQSFSGMFAGDEVMKGAMAGYTFEHMEIASYTILMHAATELGDVQLAEICRQNLEEEKAMASWLSDHAATLTSEFLIRSNFKSDAAKR